MAFTGFHDSVIYVFCSGAFVDHQALDAAISGWVVFSTRL